MSRRGRARVRDDAPINENEPRITMHALIREPGKGYVRIEARVPRSVLERYVADRDVSAPDVLEVQMGKVEAALRRSLG